MNGAGSVVDGPQGIAASPSSGRLLSLFDEPIETMPRKEAPDDVNATNVPTPTRLGPCVAHLVHPVKLNVDVVDAVVVGDQVSDGAIVVGVG